MEKNSGTEDEGDTAEEDGGINNAPAESTWNLETGTVLTTDQYPAMSTFNIPIDNSQTLQVLLDELIQAQTKIEASKIKGSFTSKSSRNSKETLYVPVARGKSRSQAYKLKITTEFMIEQSRNPLRVKEISSRLEKKFSDKFLDVVTDSGYCTQSSPSVSAAFLLL